MFQYKSKFIGDIEEALLWSRSERQTSFLNSILRAFLFAYVLQKADTIVLPN